MPRGNRTGPAGMGPMTGRAAGYCAGYTMPGFANPSLGRGFGRGMGMGFRGGRRGWQGNPFPGAGYGVPYAAPYPAVMTGQQEIDALQSQAEQLAGSLETINKRIAELESEPSKK